jgi:hypothetical protein
MALNCKINVPVPQTCDTNVSGVMKLAFLNWDETYTFSASGADCLVDTIDIGNEKFYHVNIQDNTGVATATLTVGNSKDSKAINHSVSGQIGTMDCNFLGDWKNYLLSTVIIAVLTKNRQVYIYGIDNGLIASTFAYSTGTAEGDATGTNFVFEGLQPNPPLLVKDWSVISDLF